MIANSHADNAVLTDQPDWAEYQQLRREEARGRVEAMAAELGDITTGHVTSGDPATELVREGRHLDVLVTGSRNYGPIRRLMLGSTSSGLVHHAPCAVLVTTRAAQTDEDAAHDGAGAVAAS